MSFGTAFALPSVAWQRGGSSGPAFALNFLSGTLDASVTFTRASTNATYFNSSGAMTSAGTNVPRFDYDPVGLTLRGLLVEEQRQNLLVNSLIDGTSLATQNVTVTAAAHALSFYGTGTVDLTGAFVSTVVGTGAYPTRTTLTFTPTAGTLTLTVTGTVQYANLELGTAATSFIVTAGAPATRTPDNVTVSSIPWFNAAAGTMVVESISNASTSPALNQYLANFSDATLTNRIVLFRAAAALQFQGRYTAGGVASTPTQPAVSVNGTVSKAAIAYAVGTNNVNMAVNGTLGTAASPAASPTGISRLKLGTDEGGTAQYYSGWLRTFNYYNTRLPNATLQSITV